MDTIKLTRTGQAPLEFTGEVVAEVDGSGHNINRWHNISIYRRDADPAEYVTHIAYRTQWQGELDHDTVSCDPPETVLQRYDPTQYLVGYPTGGQWEDKQRRVQQSLRERYAHQVSEVLTGFPEKI